MDWHDEYRRRLDEIEKKREHEKREEERKTNKHNPEQSTLFKA